MRTRSIFFHQMKNGRTHLWYCFPWYSLCHWNIFSHNLHFIASFCSTLCLYLIKAPDCKLIFLAVYLILKVVYKNANCIEIIIKLLTRNCIFSATIYLLLNLIVDKSCGYSSSIKTANSFKMSFSFFLLQQNENHMKLFFGHSDWKLLHQTVFFLPSKITTSNCIFFLPSNWCL